MNRLQAIFNREHGLNSSLDNDFALYRLCVAKQDSWRGIVPSNFSYDFNPEPPIFSAKFANCNGYRHILAIANEDGKIALQDTTKRNTEPEEQALSAPQCHFNAVFDLEWAPGQMRFVSASGDHTARLWEVTESNVQDLRTFVGHTRSVKTAAFRRNDPTVFATGGRDGAIIIWDTRANLNVDLTPRVDNCIYSGHMGGPSTPQSQRKRARTKFSVATTNSSSITGLAFQDANTLISCGAGDGAIKVWDLRRNYMVLKREPQPKYSLPYAGCSTFKGFTNLIVDASGSRLYANCMDNTIYCYNLGSYSTKPLQCYKGLLNSTFYVKSCLSPDGKYLLSGSSDEKAYIWNLNYDDEPVVALAGHTVEVTCVAWGATHDCPIVTCSDEARHKIWRFGPEHMTELEEKEEYRGRAISMRKMQAPKQHYGYLDLVSTPRTLKRWAQENELTPSSVIKKRNFAMLMTDNTNEAGEETTEAMTQPDAKRAHLLESRGRRLFSSNAAVVPGTSCSVSSNHTSPKMRCYNVEISPIQLNTDMGENLISPTSCNSAGNEIEPTTPVKRELPAKPNTNEATGIFSPTSNLPNYVLDGEAPHLAIMSPKRKINPKIDWLTKIRKQKLLCSPRNTMNITLTEKLQHVQFTGSNNELQCEVDSGAEHNMEMIASPRLRDLRSNESSPRVIATPKRRASQDGTRGQPKTPTSSRRSCGNTLLRFFSKQAQNSRIVEESDSIEEPTTSTNLADATTSTNITSIVTATANQLTQNTPSSSNMAADSISSSNSFALITSVGGD